MKEITINCAGITEKEALHALFAKALHFPEWYGNNLDALYDCLTDLRNVHLTLENWRSLPDWRAVFKAVLEDAENDAHGFTVTFA